MWEPGIIRKEATLSCSRQNQLFLNMKNLKRFQKAVVINLPSRTLRYYIRLFVEF